MADQAAVVSTAGGMLQQARELKGLTREAVAEQLNLLLSQVVALEENEFARFPGETFVRGHLRSYARLLKIDVDALFAAYGASTVAISSRTAATLPHVKWRPVSLERKDNLWRRTRVWPSLRWY